jgi:carbamate kinase
MKACEHVAKLGPGYVGLYCLYCQAKVAELGFDDGQLFLDRDGNRSYLAVVQSAKKQKIIQAIDEQLDESNLMVSFAGGGSVEVSLANVLLAFQDPQEVLEL